MKNKLIKSKEKAIKIAKEIVNKKKPAKQVEITKEQFDVLIKRSKIK